MDKAGKGKVSEAPTRQMRLLVVLSRGKLPGEARGVNDYLNNED
jgi:hypothetical protein